MDTVDLPTDKLPAECARSSHGTFKSVQSFGQGQNFNVWRHGAIAQ